MKVDRQEVILQILNEEQKVIASELSTRLNVSEDTIRRDLRELNQKGFLKRVHSGAVKIGPPVTDFNQRIDANLAEKIALAKRGVQLIKPGTVLLIDGGTTNYELVKQIPKELDCTIITNNVPLLTLLKDYPKIKVIALGGELYKPSLVMIGAKTNNELNVYRPDLYFMGVANFDDEIGISTAIADECTTKQKMLHVSAETVCLVTQEKLGTHSSYVVAEKEKVTAIITKDTDMTDLKVN
ncbi:DeoR/GlpR family DNA-binding transcription regulator [Oceanobacillus jeddahense]|uniref:Lactose phosphotransferase system repressor n=1 Tax=Oceanobacillus jeddahense TaxID=1462527 RepID=A0ABY5JSA5_9BACI|nr:DeoR/GlpR family DNA-binding transcription regulator [Oceanobacillus jeddahense]UUI03001.1 DeoR/GlpR family DNA-binding transcription regulator [Oceanobacillus jeddahense]